MKVKFAVGDVVEVGLDAAGMTCGRKRRDSIKRWVPLGTVRKVCIVEKRGEKLEEVFVDDTFGTFAGLLPLPSTPKTPWYAEALRLRGQA